MKVFIATDFSLTEYNSRIYLAEQHYHIIKRYEKAFADIALCARVKHAIPSESFIDATELVGKVVGLKNLVGVFKPENLNRLKKEIAVSDLIVGRFHSIIACVVFVLAKKYKKTRFAEIMGDTWDAYWNHGMVGKLIAPIIFLTTRRLVKSADYALYVTESFLQKRYPCKNVSISASNVLIKTIDKDALQRRLERISYTDYKNLTLMTTAAIDVRYKGQEFVIKAIPELNKAGVRVRYLLVGGGDAAYLRNVAKTCGVEDQVEFVGRRTLADVFEFLDQADIYIQPSLQEGLPRSVIEAMSRGCPAIGAKTAGIPELIPPECVVKRKSVYGIAETILRIANKEKMAELAKQNFEKACEYQDSVLSARRNAYYSMIVSKMSGGK